MAGKGPPPTPKKILEMRGSWHAKDRAGTIEARPGEPMIPPWLEDDIEAVRHWRHLVPILLGMGVLSPADGEALGVLCHTCARYERAALYVREHGETNEIVTKENGTHRKAHPESVLMKHLLPEIRGLLAVFGMTPSARSTIKLPEVKKQTDDKGRFFKGG